MLCVIGMHCVLWMVLMSTGHTWESLQWGASPEELSGLTPLVWVGLARLWVTPLGGSSDSVRVFQSGLILTFVCLTLPSPPLGWGTDLSAVAEPAFPSLHWEGGPVLSENSAGFQHQPGTPDAPCPVNWVATAAAPGKSLKHRVVGCHVSGVTWLSLF